MSDVSQPGFVLKMRAKPGRGEALSDLVTGLLQQSTDIDSWLVCASDDEPDTLWIFEFFKDEETLELHESNPDLEESHDAVGELFSPDHAPLRVRVRPLAGSSLMQQS